MAEPINENLVAFISELQALISENSTGMDIVIYMDESVVCNMRSAWDFTPYFEGKQIKEECVALAVTTRSITMDITAVTKEWNSWRLRVPSMSAFSVIQRACSTMCRLDVCVNNGWSI